MSSPVRVFGFDPGASGAFAYYDEESDTRTVFKFQDKTESEIAYLLRTHSPKGLRLFAFLERVGAMPKQGVSSSFKFGVSYGFLRGLLIGLEIPFEEVTPQKWQKEMGCMSKGDKRVTRAKAQQLFPELRVTHGIADGLLISEYGRRVLNQRNGTATT